ncbi:methyltransferase [Pullulanibacillus camelliae]|uniref:Methyltransferase n=1 Tax=Pullulanibacillus camelliae TaxID=1707096 RepID=A0A8J2YHR2_9BACL|nr:class I SAM-dependent methyltransferase [Pullulanibacillus camelliae]GGE43387.1 methyltransferase [Pullulanibacillus camelliae]
MSEAYQQLAFLYDHLMSEAPYDKWATFLKEHTVTQAGKHLLDMGCGTGTLSVAFKKMGFNVAGVDLSEDMLTVAQNKAIEQGVNLPLYQQNIKQLDLPERFDVITAFCDTVNYLEGLEAVKDCFQSVSHHLKKEGLFLFDVHSVRKIDDIFANNTFSSIEEEVAYIWECFQGEAAHSVYHELSFFVKEANGLYQRYDESHYQRTYPLDVYIQELEKAGFKVHSIIGDFDPDSPLDQAERWLFSAKKVNA